MLNWEGGFFWLSKNLYKQCVVARNTGNLQARNEHKYQIMFPKRAHCRTLLKVLWSLPLGASLGALLSNSRHQTKLLFGTGPNQSWDTFFLISLILSVMILYTPPGVIFRLVHPRAQLKSRPLTII